MRKLQLSICIVASAVLIASFACSTTQKTSGEGLTSAVAQNVVRIACVKAFQDVDFSALKDRPTEITLTGFADEKNRGIVELVSKTRATEAGAKIVPAGTGELELEIATMSAGNDAGRSAGLFTHAERSEGVADLQATIRDKKDGTVILTQPLKGTAKYQQRTTLGFTGTGKYSIKNAEGKFEPIDDPSCFR